MSLIGPNRVTRDILVFVGIHIISHHILIQTLYVILFLIWRVTKETFIYPSTRFSTSVEDLLPFLFLYVRGNLWGHSLCRDSFGTKFEWLLTQYQYSYSYPSSDRNRGRLGSQGTTSYIIKYHFSSRPIFGGQMETEVFTLGDRNYYPLEQRKISDKNWS